MLRQGFDGNIATGAPLVAGRDIRAFTDRAPGRIGLIRSFLVRFQKIDSPQQDAPEMPGFPRYLAAAFGPSGRQASGRAPRAARGPDAARIGGRPRLLASDLACVRGGREVFSGLSFAVGAGEALLVSGPNGAGKSSLLRLVAGLVRADGRTAGARGRRPRRHRIAEQAHYLGHQDALKPSLTVAENLDFWTRYLDGGASRARRARRRRTRRHRRACRPPISRPASGGGCRSRG